MKKCTDCQKTKQKSEFSINRAKKDGLNYRCKVCQRIYFKDYYEKNKKKHLASVKKVNKRKYKETRDFLNNLKDVPCSDCGNKFPPCAMDFDHIKGEKLFEIGWSVKLRYSKKRILKEIEKCEVVCANCHRIRTHITRRRDS